MKKLLFVVLMLLICATLVLAQEPIYDHFVYLPAVVGGVGTAGPTETPTVEPTLTPTETLIPSETPTTVSTPTVTSTPDPRGIFALPNAIAFHGSSSITQDVCLVAGEIQNDTSVFVKDIQYAIYVHQNGTLQYGTSGTMYWTIPPGGKACFRVALEGDCLDSPPEVVAEVKSYEVGDNIRVRDISFDEFTASKCFGGEVLWVDFRVHNNESVPIKNIIYRGSFYDGSGNLLGCRIPHNGWPTRFALGAGDSTYENTYFSALHYAGGSISFRFVANGDSDLNPTTTPTPTPGVTVVP